MNSHIFTAEKEHTVPRLSTTLDLFSGIGGLCMALRPFSETICYVENDPACQAVLAARMESGHIDAAPIFSDIRDIEHGPVLKPDGTALLRVDRIVGGFPCQDISSAGRQKGFGGNKSSLFHHLMHAVRRFRPSEVILENVANILAMPTVWKVVFKSLHDAGYHHIRWCTVSAGDVGAPHLRRRCFFLATRAPPARLHSGAVPGVHDEPNGYNSYGWNIRKTGPRRGEPSIPRFKKIDERSKRKQSATVPELTAMRRRLRQLGNVVCPPQGRLAVQCLWNSCGTPIVVTTPRRGKTATGRRQLRSLPSWGYVHAGEDLVALSPPRLPAYIPWPKRVIFPPPLPKGVRADKFITKPWVRPRWPTPMCSNFNFTTRLTLRRTKDMGSALYYDRDTTEEERASVRLNPMFIEWMMGLPPNFTKV